VHLDDAEAVAGRVPEPGDGVPLAVMDAALVLLVVRVSLHRDAAGCQVVYRPPDVVDTEIEDGEGTGGRVGSDRCNTA
jgi:hypothetical protein